MFFNSHKKDAKKIGEECLFLLKKCFFKIGNDHFDSLDTPNGFFDDPYIIGYFQSFLRTNLDYVIGGQNWSKNKKGEFVNIAFNIIDESQTLLQNHVRLATDETYREMLFNNQDYINGGNDAVTFLLTSWKVIKPDDPDPKLAEARKLAPQLEEQNRSLGIFTEEELEKDNLPVAILMVTIINYVQINWKN